MTLNTQSSFYTPEEDKLLCQVYLHITQNPNIGINQSRDRIWSRIAHEYKKSRVTTAIQERPARSLQARMHIILPTITKLKSCVKQIENLNHSDASKDVILSIISTII